MSTVLQKQMPRRSDPILVKSVSYAMNLAIIRRHYQDLQTTTLPCVELKLVMRYAPITTAAVRTVSVDCPRRTVELAVRMVLVKAKTPNSTTTIVRSTALSLHLD